VLGTNQTHATNQSLLKSIAYDGVKDFAPVIGIADIAHVLVVRRELQAASVADLIAFAKASPGKLNYGSTGVGSASHLCAELFKTKAGVDIQPVHFRGSAPMLQELLGERLDLSFATLPSVISQIDSGALPALAVASPRRAVRLESIPTLSEAGVDDVEADAWFTLFAPAKTPAAVIERLHAAISAALKKDAPKATIAQQGMTMTLRSPSEVAASLPAEVERWAAVIKATNIKVE
jgi:tripartite-type tricarboxylate transporter receptor subunit TctC